MESNQVTLPDGTVVGILDTQDTLDAASDMCVDMIDEWAACHQDIQKFLAKFRRDLEIHNVSAPRRSGV